MGEIQIPGPIFSVAESGTHYELPIPNLKLCYTKTWTYMASFKDGGYGWSRIHILWEDVKLSSNFLQTYFNL